MDKRPEQTSPQRYTDNNGAYEKMSHIIYDYGIAN